MAEGSYIGTEGGGGLIRRGHLPRPVVTRRNAARGFQGAAFPRELRTFGLLQPLCHALLCATQDAPLPGVEDGGPVRTDLKTNGIRLGSRGLKTREA